MNNGLDYIIYGIIYFKLAVFVNLILLIWLWNYQIINPNFKNLFSIFYINNKLKI